MKKKSTKKSQLKQIEEKTLKEANNDYIGFKEKIASNNKFYFLVVFIVVLLLIALFLLLHFTNVI